MLDDVLDDFANFTTSAEHVEFYWMPGTPPLPGEAQPPHDRTGPATVEARLRPRQVRRRERRVRVVCRIGRRFPALAPRLAKLVASAASERDLIDRSDHIFCSPRRVRFVEMEYGIPVEAIPEAVGTRSRPDRHALVPAAVPDRGSRVGGRRHPVVDRYRSGERVDRRPPVPRRAVRVVLPGRRGDHGRLRGTPALGQAPLPVGDDVADPVPAVGPVHRRQGRARSGWDVPQRVPRPRARPAAHVVKYRRMLPDGAMDASRRCRRPLASRTIPRVQRRRTTTSNFGVGRRESHDASGFYGRFEPPVLDDDATVLPPKPVEEPFVCGDARNMHTLAENSVALVVTSPPYFAGKQYEEELERDGVPSSYLEYLELLADVFADCVRVLEPGGRIAANVANLGRKPYRSLVVRRGAHPARPPRSAAARRDRVAEERRCQRIVRVGLVPQPDQPGAARRDGADHRRQQGPLRAAPARSSNAATKDCRRRARSPPRTSWR